LQNKAWASITPAGGVDRDPIAVQRHVDAALGPETRVGGPGDVGEQAGGEAEPRHLRAVVEGGRDPGVEHVAMLLEAAEPRARLDQGIEPALVLRQLIVEQAFADAEAGFTVTLHLFRGKDPSVGASQS
jgi:hypothetical protein